VNEFRRLAGMMEYEFPSKAGVPAAQKSLGEFGA
jgi:hypothetical protein